MNLPPANTAPRCISNLLLQSRQNFKDATRHTILGMQNFKPQEFATQMALNTDNGWGIV
ncbi:unnamed protein product, partial [Rotaria socialis]